MEKDKFINFNFFCGECLELFDSFGTGCHFVNLNKSYKKLTGQVFTEFEREWYIKQKPLPLKVCPPPFEHFSAFFSHLVVLLVFQCVFTLFVFHIQIAQIGKKDNAEIPKQECLDFVRI